MKFAPFDYAAPTSVAEAVALLAQAGGKAKALAGGQSLLPTMAFRMATPTLLVDLCKIPGLDKIAIDDNGVRLGARVRWRDIEEDTRLKTAHPLLVAAIQHVAHYQIRNRGTVGGSCAERPRGRRGPRRGSRRGAVRGVGSPRGFACGRRVSARPGGNAGRAGAEACRAGGNRNVKDSFFAHVVGTPVERIEDLR